MANEFVTRTGLIVSGSTFLPAVTTASKGYILSFDDTTKQVYYMSTSSVTVTVPGSDTQIIYNNGGAFGASSNFVFSGSNVGIGTTSPTYKLHVSSSNNNDGIAIHYPANNSTQFPFYIGDNSSNIYTRINATEFEFKRNGAASTIKTVGSSNNLVLESVTNLIFNTDGANTRMYIDTSGNVGIGTTSPSARLHISGSTDATQRIIVDGSGNNSSLHLNYNGSNVGFISSYQNSELNIGTSISAFVNFYTNNTERMRITSAGNVGIGTSSPGAKLNVRGGNILIDNTTLIQWGFGDGTTYIYGDASNPTGSLKLGTANADRLTVTYAGNVGIGTTSPSSLLHVSGTTPTVIIEGSSTNSAKINLVGSFTTWALENQYVNGATNDMFRIYNSQLGANAITINRLSNNVGIGTTSPNATLDVSGNVLISGSLTVSGSSTFTNIGPAVFSGSITQTASTASFGGIVGIGTTTPTQKFHVNSGNAFINGAIYFGDASHYLVTDNGSYAMLSSNRTLQLATSGNPVLSVFNTQNVAIGSTTDSAKLFIKGSGATSSTTALLVQNSGATASLAVYDNNATLVTGRFGVNSYSNNSFSYFTSTVSNPSIPYVTIEGYAVASSPLLVLKQINTAGNSNLIEGYHFNATTQSFYLADSGNAYFRGIVGIGNSSPSYKLDVSGSGNFTSNLTVTGSLTVSGSSTFTNIGPAVFTGSITQNASTASFGGLVGIGTTTPAYKLDVNGTGRFASGLDVDSYILTRTKLQISNGRLFELIGTSDALNIYDGSAGASRIYISGSGNVGIGTTTPAAKLEIVGASGLQIRNGAADGFSFTQANTNSWAWTGLTGGSNYSIQNANVGIGTTAPTATLEVIGNVKATSFTGSFSGSVSAPGSTTQIVYNSGGALAADSGLVYSGSRVGIGISSPSYKLDVDGDIRSGGSDPLVILQPNSGTYAFLQKLNASNGDFLRLYDGTDYSMFWKNTNVGIGTSNPSAKLQTVSSGLGDGGGIRITNSGAGGDDYRIWPTATVNGEGAGKLIFSNNGGNVLTLTSGGNIGIGTISPSYKLHVDSNTDSLIKVSNGTETYIKSTYFGYSSTYDAIQIGDTYGKGNNGVSVALGIDPAIIAGGAFSGYEIALPDLTEFITANGPSGSATDWNQNVLVLSGSNVGIGTGTPAYKLDVAGSSRSDMLILRSNQSAPTADAFIFRPADNTVALGTANTERMRIDASGNVGIGTTSPGAKLTVYSDTTTDGIVVDVLSKPRITLRDRGNSDTILGTGDYGLDDFFIDTYSGNAFAIKGSTRNVGIGTTTPGELLEVVGNIRANVSNGGGFMLTGASASGLVRAGATGLALRTNTTDRLTIDNSGNVGIGITSPSTPLHIAKNSTYNNVSTAAFRIANITSPNKGIDFGYDNTADVGFIQGIEFGVQAKNLSLQSDGGSVGIGTTSPSYKLDVNGTLGVSGNATFNGGNVYINSDNSFIGNNTTDVVSLSGGTVYLPGNGNVGIGTISPFRKLVVDNSNSGGTGGYVRVQNELGGAGANVGVDFATFSPQYYSASLFSLDPTAQIQATDISNYSGRLDVKVRTEGVSGSLATVASFARNGNVGIGTTTPSYNLHVSSSGYYGGNLTVEGTITAQKLNVQQITSSVIYSSGSNIFGNSIANTQTFTGSLQVTGSTHYLLGNVGIGTTTPAYKLDVLGTDDITPEIRIGNSSGKTAFIGFSNTYDFTIDAGGAGGNYLNLKGGANGSTGGIIFSTFALERMQIDYTGNVGIGTSSPSSRLSLGLGIGPKFLLFDNPSTGVYSGLGQDLAAGDSTDLFAHGLSNVGFLTFGKLGTNKSTYTEWMRITPTGNVGIGTTTPSNKLQVAGGITATSFTGSFSGSITAPGSTTQVAFNSGGTLSADSGFVYSGSRVGIGTSSPNNKLDIRDGNIELSDSTYSNIPEIRFTANSGGRYVYAGIKADEDDSYNGHLEFWTTPTSANHTAANATFAERMRITAAGNVGIGTTSPGYKLQVYNSSNGTTAAFGGTTYGVRIDNGGTFSSGRSTIYGVDNTFYGSYQPLCIGASTLAFSISGTDKVTIDTAGNVGIGTTSPDRSLLVSGSIGAYVADGQGTVSITVGEGSNVGGNIISLETNAIANTTRLYNNGTGTNFNIGSTGASSDVNLSARKDIALRINNGGDVFSGTTALFITGSTGNVGIGLTNPDYAKLMVAATNHTGFAVTRNGSNAAALYLGNNGNDIARIAANNADLQIGRDFIGTFTPYVTVQNDSGNVGIGTTSPNNILHLYTNYAGSSNSGSAITITSDGSGGDNGWIGVNKGTGNGLTLGVENRDIIFQTDNTTAFNGTERMRITTDGNVGINTASPSAKLEIAGFSTGAGLKLNYGNSSGTIEAVNFIANGGANGVIGMQMVSAGVGDLWLGGSGGRALTLYRDGNVGIGTSSPSAKLEVTGNIYANESSATAISVYNSNSIRAKMSMTGNEGDLTLYGSSANAVIYLSAYYNSYFNGGNVGIGTTSPAGKLTVKSPGEVSSYGDGFVLERNANSAKLVRIYESGADGYLEVRTGNNDIISKLSGYSGTSSYFLSSVGIGTTTPNAKLDLGTSINGNYRASFFMYNDNTAGIYHGTKNGFYMDQFGLSNNTLLSFSTAASAPGTLMLASKNTDVSSSAALTPRMTILGESGYVGIGTTTPSTKLVVSGSHVSGQGMSTFKGSDYAIVNLVTPATGDGSIGYWGFRVQDSSFNDLMWFGHVTSSTQSGFVVAPNFDTTNSASFYVARSNGNVGIGTTSPDDKLEIEGGGIGINNTSDPYLRFRESGTIVSDIFTDTSANNLVVRGSSGHGVEILANGASEGAAHLVVSGSGNVGIGTTNPSDKLTVAGNMTLTQLINGTDTVLSLISKTAVGNSRTATIEYDADDERIYFKNAGTTVAVMDSSGNVGIGTTNPSQKLQVSGSIAIENQGTTTIESTTFAGSLTTNTNIASVPTASFKAAFFDYYVASGSVNMRAGTVMAVHNNSTSRYTDTSTADIGNTAAVDFTTSVVGGNLVLTANISSGTWEIKTAYRAL